VYINKIAFQSKADYQQTGYTDTILCSCEDVGLPAFKKYFHAHSRVVKWPLKVRAFLVSVTFNFIPMRFILDVD